MTTVTVADEIAACARRVATMAPSSPVAGNLSRLLGRLGRRLSRPPRAILIGEFNSGKSTLANALIGREVLPTSFQANTRLPLLAHYADQPTLVLECRDGARLRIDDASLAMLRSSSAHMLHVGLPVEALKKVELIDTPGLGSGIVRPDNLFVDACRRAHIAVWCTSATQAWKASEQAVWLSLPPRLKRNGLLVATRADGINVPRDRERLEARLHAEARGRFAGIVMLDAAEAEETSRHPQADDYADRWENCGGRNFAAQLQSLLEREQANREQAARRLLDRTLARLTPADAATRAAA